MSRSRIAPNSNKTAPDTSTWQFQTAKARFGEVVHLARTIGPQRITRQGREGVVIVAEEEYERLTARAHRPKSLVQFLRESPLAGIDLDLERDRTPCRKTGV
jgi:antitoxin Phd